MRSLPWPVKGRSPSPADRLGIMDVDRPRPGPSLRRPLVAVVGSGLAGVAAAARLQALGAGVVVIEQSGEHPGIDPSNEPDGRTFWGRHAWNRLFTDIGGDLGDAVAADGLHVEPAPPTRHATVDGELELSTAADAQVSEVAEALGPDAAQSWDALLVALDRTTDLVTAICARLAHQATGLSLAERRALQVGRTTAGLAATLPHPALADIVLEIPAWLGQDPRRLPAWHAHRLAQAARGRWLLVRDDEAQPASRLVDILRRQLHDGGAQFHFGEEVTAIRTGPRLHTTAGTLTADAVISTVNPFTHADLTRERPDQKLTRRLRATLPSGPLWRDWRTLLDLPRLEPSLPRVIAASGWSPAGPDSWAQLETGRMAAALLAGDLGLTPRR